MEKGWLFYFLDSVLDLALTVFGFSEYYVVGRVAKSENTKVLSTAQCFCGLCREHAKSRFRQHTSIARFDRIIAFKVPG